MTQVVYYLLYSMTSLLFMALVDEPRLLTEIRLPNALSFFKSSLKTYRFQQSY